MPVIPFLPLIAAGVGGAATVYASGKQSDAQNQATQASLQSNQAQQAYLTHQQQIDQENFNRTQATNQANFEATQRANYGQWAARQQNLGPYIGAGTAANNALAGALGLTFTNPTIPPYAGAGSGASGGGSGSRPPAGIDASKGDIAGQISAYFKSQGVSDTETPYWVQKWSEFGAKDPGYFNTRLAQADIFGGQAGKIGGSAAPMRQSGNALPSLNQFAQLTSGGAAPNALNNLGLSRGGGVPWGSALAPLAGGLAAFGASYKPTPPVAPVWSPPGPDWNEAWSDPMMGTGAY